MPAALDHVIVHANDKHASAAFLAEILGLEVGPEMGPFVPVTVANGVTLDFATSASFEPEHYAFVLSEDEFDAAFARLQEQGVAYYAWPGGGGPGEVNHRFGGTGCYFPDPSGHAMEIFTRPASDGEVG
jgi:catechol 2,3-dioxygenase-like lactoylglutathione lyase family enzyme